jgi:hypothetical protein
MQQTFILEPKGIVAASLGNFYRVSYLDNSLYPELATLQNVGMVILPEGVERVTITRGQLILK